MFDEIVDSFKLFLGLSFGDKVKSYEFIEVVVVKI